MPRRDLAADKRLSPPRTSSRRTSQAKSKAKAATKSWPKANAEGKTQAEAKARSQAKAKAKVKAKVKAKAKVTGTSQATAKAKAKANAKAKARALTAAAAAENAGQPIDIEVASSSEERSVWSIPWACGVCTLVNSDGNIWCNACGTRRGNTFLSSSSLESTSSSSTSSFPSGTGAPLRVERRLARFVRQPSAATAERIERALAQRLYLLSAQRHNDAVGASFAVLGSTGNVYNVEFDLMPHCNCPDFLRGRGVCKHVLFIWLRVLRCPEDDVRIWQKALLSSELKAAVEPLFTRKQRRLPSMADKAVRDAYERATGTAGDAEEGDEGSEAGRRRRKTLDGEECSVCFEVMTESEEKRKILDYCCSCGNNFHKDCIRRWQQASSGDCPLCRETWISKASSDVKPGDLMPRPKPQVVSRPFSGGGFRGGYLNLRS